jgi:outer membrane cobalamin receptor
MPRPPGRSCRPFSFSFPIILVLILLAAATTASAETLRGRVLDQHAQPIAAADVLVLHRNTVITSTRTLANGQFGPIDVPAGEYEIVASAPGLRSAPKPFTVKTGDSIEIDLTVAPSAVHESIVVSASQVEMPLTRVTDSVSVITRARIDAQQVESLPDVLREIPGLGVVASGGRGAVTSVFPRGGESDYTLVLVDGVPQNTFGGFVDFSQFATGEIERVEVVRGPQSALYGGGAIGAIVHVITQHGRPMRASGSFETGSNGTYRAAASTAGSRDAWRWGLSFDGLSTDGDTRVFPGSGGPVVNDDYQRASGAGSLAWSDSPGRQIRVDVRAGRSERGFPGPYGSDPLGRYEGIDLISRGITAFRSVAGMGAFRTAKLRHRAHGTWSGAEGDFTSPFGPSEDRTSRVTGRYQVDASAGRVDLSAGWEFVRERADNTFITGEDAEQIPVKRSINGWFIEARPVGGRRGFVNAGARVERIERAALEADPFAFTPRPALEPDVVWSVNPKVSAAWFVKLAENGTWTKVRAGAGTGIKPPTAFEIAFTDNPGLRPERSRSFDAGIEQSFAASTMMVDATAFANWYDELIVTVGSSFSGASRYRSDNIANARAWGLETGATWRPSTAVSIRAAWTWLATEILGVDRAASEAPAPYHVGDPLIRRPGHQVSVDFGWTRGRASAFAIVNGRSDTPDLEPNFADQVFENPGYATVAIGGAFRVGRNVEVFARVTNLFDRAYEETFGFPALGRSGLVGVRVTGSR